MVRGAVPRCVHCWDDADQEASSHHHRDPGGRPETLAATRFPELAGSRSELLLRLTEVAEASLLEQPADRDDARAEAKRRVLERTRRTTAEEAEEILAAREADWHRDFGS